MALPAYQTADALHFVMPHSRDLPHTNGMQGGNADTLKRLNEIYGMRKARHLTMDGSGYNSGVDLGEILGLGQKPRIETGVERNALDSLHDNDLDGIARLHFQLDMIAAAGTMTPQLEGVIAELTASKALSALQKEKFLTLIGNQATLAKLNDGRLSAAPEIIAGLANETVALLKDLGKEPGFPPALKDMTAGLLRETATRHALPDVISRLETLDRDLSPAHILAQSVETLTEALTALLNQGDLDKELREEISAVLDKLTDTDDNMPLPRDVIKALASLSEKPAAQSLVQIITATREANLLLKAEISGLSLPRIKSIEALIDRLDAIKSELGADRQDLAEQIRQTIETLDKKPGAMESLVRLTQLDDILKTLDKGALPESLAELITTAQEQSKFVLKIQTDAIAGKAGIEIADVKNIADIYIRLETLQNQDGINPDLKERIKNTLESVSRNPVGIASIATLQILQADKLFPAIISGKPEWTGLADKIGTYAALNMKKTAESLGTSVGIVLKTVDAAIAVRTAAFPDSLKSAAQNVLNVIENAPLTVRAAAAVSQFANALPPALNTGQPPVIKKLGDAVTAQVSHISKTVGLLPQTVKAALSSPDPEKTVLNIAAHAKTIAETPKAVAKELTDIAKAVSGSAISRAAHSIAATINATTQSGAKTHPAITKAIEKAADTTRQIPEQVRERILAVVDVVKQGFKAPQPTPPEQTAKPGSHDPFDNFQQARQAPSFKEQFKQAASLEQKVELATTKAIQSLVSTFKGCGSGACGSCPVKCGSNFAKAAGEMTGKTVSNVLKKPISFIRKFLPA